MAVIPISRLLEVESAHTVSFDRDGREYSWDDFGRAAAGLGGVLADESSRYWALDCSNPYEFAYALYGCWMAGKTPVLAPAHMLVDDNSAVEFDGIIVSAGSSTSAAPAIDLDDIEPANLSAPIVSPASDLVLFTSGSTGQPTKVHRVIHNFEAELDVLESVFGDAMENCRIYSTVSCRHVYGLLFRLLWPLVTRRAFANFNFEYPENLLANGDEHGTLVSSPALLKRMGHISEPASTPWRSVFSSGGLLPGYAASDAQRLLGTCPFEVLGSTETSGVAWRQQCEGGGVELWHTLPEVRVRQDDEGFLEVSSPFMGLSSWHRMGDKVKLETNRTFELLGRGDHIVKIEDKRVSLAEVEQCAIDLPWIVDAAATALEDGSRQMVGLVLSLDDAGKARLSKAGRKDVSDEVRTSLRERLDPVAVPKKIRYVDAIPVNPQGKRQPSVIRGLFD